MVLFVGVVLKSVVVVAVIVLLLLFDGSYCWLVTVCW